MKPVNRFFKNCVIIHGYLPRRLDRARGISLPINRGKCKNLARTTCNKRHSSFVIVIVALTVM
jgi:hypothetical protein